MNLKFVETCWTEAPELLYIRFRSDGQQMEWFPKWDDLRQLIQAAVITEGQQTRWQSPEVHKFKALFLELIELIQFSEGVACAEQLQGVDFFPKATQPTAA